MQVLGPQHKGKKQRKSRACSCLPLRLPRRASGGWTHWHHRPTFLGYGGSWAQAQAELQVEFVYLPTGLTYELSSLPYIQVHITRAPDTVSCLPAYSSNVSLFLSQKEALRMRALDKLLEPLMCLLKPRRTAWVHMKRILMTFSLLNTSKLGFLSPKTRITSSLAVLPVLTIAQQNQSPI